MRTALIWLTFLSIVAAACVLSAGITALINMTTNPVLQ